MERFVKIVVLILVILSLFIFLERPFSQKEKVIEKKEESDPLKKIWKEYQQNRSLQPKKYSREEFLKISEDQYSLNIIEYAYSGKVDKRSGGCF